MIIYRVPPSSLSYCTHSFDFGPLNLEYIYMENWGSWTFSEENKNLLVNVLNKFATDQCSLDASKKAVLSTLAATSKTARLVETSSSSSSDDSDIEGDFIAVQKFFPKLCVDITMASVEDPHEPENTAVSDKFDNESSFLSQPDTLVEDKNTTKLIIELLNAGDCDAQELDSMLKTEQRNRTDMSEIIGEVWPEMVTDKARHDLCKALVITDVKPQVICERIYFPWFETCKSNLTGFIESLSNTIVHFPEYACKSFLVRLLEDKESILVKHVDWLVEIMKNLNRRHWCTLLNEYMKHCGDALAEHQIPVMLQLVKNCQDGLNDGESERLVWLCRNAARAHFANRDFAGFLAAVIATVDLAKFRPEMTAICGQLKGASKFLIAKALKDAK